MTDKGVTPSWDGNPTTFETYVTAAKWYEKGTKASARPLVVARLWSQLSGAAKSVVRYLEPEAFEGPDGLQRFLDVLRASPLQQLPVPDSFGRLEKWHSLRRSDRESMAELIVREEELFTELQQSLMRARHDRGVTTKGQAATLDPSSPLARDPPSTPGMSPTTTGWTRGQHQQTSPGDVPRPSDAPRSMYPTLPQATSGAHITGDFFEDELRGYRLLRASRISGSERQNVLVQTGNSTSFVLVRRALRTLFSEDGERHGHGSNTGKFGKIWYEDWDGDLNDDGSYESMWWSDWNDWDDWSQFSPTYWQDDDAWWWHDWQDEEATDDVAPNDQSADPEEVQLVEAYNIANEASKTLKDAREAVRRVRQARGYYAPESASGKGIVPSSASPSSSPS